MRYPILGNRFTLTGFYSVFCFFALFFIFLIIGCAKSETTFREYTEITSGGGKFGKQGGLTGFTQGNSRQISSIEIELFNKVTYNGNLADGIAWKTPKGWKEVKETGIRLVSFKTENSLEVTLIGFPGNVGGISANLSRWVGQIEAKLDDQALQEMIRSLGTGKNKNGLPYILVDFDAQKIISEQNKPKTILAAIFGFKDQMLFIKVIGDKLSVYEERKAFEYLVDNIQLGRKS